MRVQSHQSLSFQRCKTIIVEVRRLFNERYSLHINELTQNQISLYRKLHPRQSASLEILSKRRNFQYHENDLETTSEIVFNASFHTAAKEQPASRASLRKFELFMPAWTLDHFLELEPSLFVKPHS